MLQLQSTILAQVIEQALADAAAHPRWLSAIRRAAVELESNPWIDWQDDHLLIASPSGQTYSANGSCQCIAFAHGQACWHRAAARLVRRYHEALERAANPAPVRDLSTTVDTPPADWPRDLATGQPLDWYAAKAAVEAGRVAPLGDRLTAARAKLEMAELFS